MHKIDTNGDGMISKMNGLLFRRSFAMLDKNKTGNIDAKEFISPNGGELVSLPQAAMRAAFAPRR